VLQGEVPVLLLCTVLLSWEVFEIESIAGEFGMLPLNCCLHNIKEEDWCHIIPLLYACFIIFLAYFFAEFQLDRTVYRFLIIHIIVVGIPYLAIG